MSYKEQFYEKVGKLDIAELKAFLKVEDYTFEAFKDEYFSWKAEEERYKRRLDRLNSLPAKTRHGKED